MPELPEAEANRRRIEADALNRTIEGFWLGDTEHVDIPGDNERARLVGRQITETRRHGKIIFAGSKSGPWLAVHLGMTGSLRPYDGEERPEYTRIAVEFEGDRRLGFRDPRKFGWMKVIDDPETYLAEDRVGPDARQIGRDAFREVIGGSGGALKSALMNQGKLAGLGNLWSDEMLFQTGVAPTAKGSDLDEETLDALFDAMGEVLGTLIEVNADYSKLPSDWLKPGRKEGADCPRCGGTIAKRKVGGRTAFYCDSHQGA
ncbi:formamidopyrimidine-DNA glycosylase [Palleronia aestuarii]|uniref:Formamidopyrimidine-DNA glycosylase n=1 Tax=Palleronia aestuarii TaxID=568105 RepID=A0A2W7N8K5_9RHOB|nr:DNA-formamidopyrimidine glycosylase family protein [Palleronia aestuarii]PZX16511.1 formamidopyrimidine-DNA glycosylase [Palleronia aestuarii]